MRYTLWHLDTTGRTPLVCGVYEDAAQAVGAAERLAQTGHYPAVWIVVATFRHGA